MPRRARERTPLVFLSACRTAEQGNVQAPGRHPGQPALQPGSRADDAGRFEPFVHALIRAGVANVLGWDGSVGDPDAIAFAEHLYSELASYQTLPWAVAQARRLLMADPERGHHWHMARITVGPAGGGTLADKGLPKRRLAGADHEQQFLDQARGEVPVAARAAFVGRRRQAQAVLRAFRDDAAGVLIHGMGSLGKSSLAARIASRMNDHRTVVLFRRYDALSVFDRVVEAIPASRRQGFKDTWRDALLADPATLADALEALLEDPLDQAPILLIVDDLESILQTPDPSQIRTPVQRRLPLPVGRPADRLCQVPERRPGCCSPAATGSRCPMRRAAIWPTAWCPFRCDRWTRGSGASSCGAATRLATTIALDERTQALAERALSNAGGNPGLQAALVTPILAGEAAAAEQALAAIEHYRRAGVPPDAIQYALDRGAARTAPTRCSPSSAA